MKTIKKKAIVKNKPDNEREIADLKARAFDINVYQQKINNEIKEELNAIYNKLKELTTK